MTNQTTITVKRLTPPMMIGGAGGGNIYRYKVTRDRNDGTTPLVTLAASERDVAYDFNLEGLAVPEGFEGPYDCFGRNQCEGEAQ